MRVWKNTGLDSILFMLSVMQFIFMLLLAGHWENASALGKIGNFAFLTLMIVYNIIVISHLFTHTSWFVSPLMNSFVSMLNSINIGQSVQAYHFKHVRNHHRFNNDQKALNGKTNDFSSTFQEGKKNEHASLFRYAFVGAFSSLLDISLREIVPVLKLWCLGKIDHDLLELASKSPDRRTIELKQLRLDRLAHFLAICLFVFISWKWTLLCYLPAFFLALALVNMQNYYEHYGAMPGSKAANSVSHYGRLYNIFSFNDGYHQEHHLRPAAHWHSMPDVYKTYQAELNQTNRIISPVPAILGFLDRKRVLLHRLQSKITEPNLTAREQGVACD